MSFVERDEGWKLSCDYASDQKRKWVLFRLGRVPGWRRAHSFRRQTVWNPKGTSKSGTRNERSVQLKRPSIVLWGHLSSNLSREREHTHLCREGSLSHTGRMGVHRAHAASADLLALHAWLGRWNRNHCARTWPCVWAASASDTCHYNPEHTISFTCLRAAHILYTYYYTFLVCIAYTPRAATKIHYVLCAHSDIHMY